MKNSKNTPKTTVYEQVFRDAHKIIMEYKKKYSSEGLKLLGKFIFEFERDSFFDGSRSNDV